MRWFKLIFVVSLIFVVTNVVAQKERKYIRQGNREFDKENFSESEIAYRKAMDLDEKKTYKPLFNVGDALYKQEKYEEAIEQFNGLADYELSKEEKARIYHNLGNSLLQSNKLKESIEAYKNALRNNPNDMDTKYNLAYAQKKLEQQQQQQNQDQNQDQNKDQNKDNQDQNQDQQNQDQNDDKQDQNKDQNQQDKQDQNQDQQQQQQQPQISKEDAERILQALANDEKETQKKVKEQKAAAAKVKTEKEW